MMSVVIYILYIRFYEDLKIRYCTASFAWKDSDY